MLMDLQSLETELAGLLPRIAGGDRQAFSRLYDLSAGRLNAVVRRIVRRPELAEEALQETFVRIWQRASQYEPAQARSLGWLAAIARNQAIDLKRRFAERVSDASDSDEDINIAVPAEAENTMEYRRLRHCLSKLPEDRQNMVLLAYYQGFTREELAEKFKRPITTVKTLLRRSLITLRECLDGQA
jgi:RNA polymerase sigma-70 factor (ECF subfamily)